jgi:hypothetical protein
MSAILLRPAQRWLHGISYILERAKLPAWSGTQKRSIPSIKVSQYDRKNFATCSNHMRCIFTANRIIEMYSSLMKTANYIDLSFFRESYKQRLLQVKI